MTPPSQPAVRAPCGPLSAMAAALLSVSLAVLAMLAGCATPGPAVLPAVAVAEPVSPPSPQAPLTMPATSPPLTLVKPAPALPAAAAVVASVPAAAIDPWGPGLPVDLEAPAARADLWTRLRLGFVMAEIDTPLVRKWEQYYAGKPDYVQRMTERGGRYLFHIVEELALRGLPTELALLPFVESAFNPQAMSSAKASGMWQFVPATGRDFALRQNIFRDDRRDVLASTRAALDYFQLLERQFGDWQLVLAAYNWGQGNVQRALDRQQRKGQTNLQTLGYADLTMPEETRNYLPKLQAIKNIVLRPEAFGLSLPPLLNHPYFLSVQITRDIDVALAAGLAGLSLEAFKQLNPQMNKPVILANGTPQILLPYDSAATFVRALASHTGELASWTAWPAPRTLKLAEAARLVGMGEAQLRELNAIPPKMLIKAGSVLLVPRDAGRGHDVAQEVAEHATLSLSPEPLPLRRVSIHAGKHGESVAAIAQRYRVSAAQVALWNQTKAGASFKPGQAVVLMLAPGQAGQPQARLRVAAKGSTGAARKPARPSAASPSQVARS